MRPRPLRAAAGCAALLLALGCGDGTGPLGDAGDVRFRASGDVTGGFAARGGYPGPELAGTRSWSFAADYQDVFQTPTPLHAISASAHVGGSVSNVFSLSLEDVRAGVTYTCDAATVAAGDCAFLGGLGIGNDWESDADPPLEREYGVVSGTVTMLEVGERLRGTFRLTLREVDSGAAAEITDGSFDVPVLPLSEVLVTRLPLRTPALR